MAINFRKRIKIAPGVNINLSKSGISGTFGPKGANVNIGKKGAYLNTGIPGTGIYARQKISKRSNNTGPVKFNHSTTATPKMINFSVHYTCTVQEFEEIKNSGVIPDNIKSTAKILEKPKKNGCATAFVVFIIFLFLVFVLNSL